MPIKTCSKSIIAAIAILFASSGLAAPKVAAKPTPVKTLADGVEVRKDPDNKAEVIATLKKGENLTATGRKGSYWRVKLSDGREGFVPVTSVQTKAGMNAIKSAIGNAGTQVGEAATAVKDAVSEKADAAKAESKPAPPAPKTPELKSKDLEKAANKLFKK